MPPPLYLNRNEIARTEIAKRVQESTDQAIDTSKRLNLDTARTVFETAREKTNETVGNMTASNERTNAQSVSNRTQIDTLFDRATAAGALIASQNFIDSTSVVLLKALQSEQKQIDDITAFLNPDSLRAISDSIVLDKLEEYSKKKYFFNITQHEEDSIRDVAKAEMEQLVEQKYKEMIESEGRIDLIMRSHDFVIIQEKVLALNLSLQKLAVTASNNSYFESGQDTLTQEREDTLRKNVGKFFDGMFDTLDLIFAVLPTDTTIYASQLRIFVYGFTDSEQFVENSTDCNDSLSQRRADEVNRIILEVYKEKLNRVKFQNITFRSPLEFSKGFGENLPNPNKKEIYEGPGLKDQKRRTAILRFTFGVTSPEWNAAMSKK